jgi:hypothetical protein
MSAQPTLSASAVPSRIFVRKNRLVDTVKELVKVYEQGIALIEIMLPIEAGEARRKPVK